MISFEFIILPEGYIIEIRLLKRAIENKAQKVCVQYIIYRRRSQWPISGFWRKSRGRASRGSVTLRNNGILNIQTVIGATNAVRKQSE